MAKKETTKKKRNPQDATLRNIHGVRDRIIELERRLRKLEKKVKKLKHGKR